MLIGLAKSIKKQQAANYSTIRINKNVTFIDWFT